MGGHLPRPVGFSLFNTNLKGISGYGCWSSVCVVDPEWSMSGDGSDCGYEVAQAHQSWWMGNPYGKSCMPLRSTIARKEGQIFACWLCSANINVFHLGWAARNGWIQAGSLLVRRERLPSLIIVSSNFPDMMKWVLYIVQSCIMGKNISYYVGRSFNTVWTYLRAYTSF